MKAGYIWIPFCLLFLIFGCESPITPEQAFDQSTRQSPVTRHAQIDSVMGELTIVPFSKLAPAYLKSADEVDPAQQVVRNGREDGPGAVGVEPS